MQLPIDPHLPEIAAALREHSIVVIEAPPGTGKTTRVAPYLLLTDPQFFAQKIYLLQPRRLAARSVAERIAFELGGHCGERIGYQVRFENRVSPQTRLVVATEGILLRRLLDDPAIEDISVVFLDEFHERSLDADLLLGMLRRVQQTLRNDLKIVLMSATINVAEIRSALQSTGLKSVPLVQVAATNFPVDIRYRPVLGRESISDAVASTLLTVAAQHEGDILVFLPGAGEIHRTLRTLESAGLQRQAELLPLYGSLPLAEQTRIIEPGPRRKIVLATNIAETSLTIEGVRVVVDSGYARVMRYSPEVGLDRLSLETISQASATQRTGRAGRVAPGTCYRLWSEAAQHGRPERLEPEILRKDLASAVLQMTAWGESSTGDFPWLTSPAPDSLHSASKLLTLLGALNEGKITKLGEQMARLPLPPRLARMVLEAERLGCLTSASLLAAMLSDRDPFSRGDSPGQPRTNRPPVTSSVRRWKSDSVERVRALERFLHQGTSDAAWGDINHTAARNIQQSAEQIASWFAARSAPPATDELDDDALLRKSLLAGYPDRVAKRRSVGSNKGLMVGGKGVVLGPTSGVTEAEFFLCIDIDQGTASDALVRQASQVESEWLLEQAYEHEELFFHPSQKMVVARKQLRWDDLVLRETPTAVTDTERSTELLQRAVRQDWRAAFPHGDESLISFIERARCLGEWLPELELPTIDDALLLAIADAVCLTCRSLSEVQQSSWLGWLQARFTPEQLRTIESEAPARITVPNGSSLKIEYQQGQSPVLAVKIQHVFSWKTTPRIARGRVPLLLHLLSPAMRPQQVTSDLASFWANGYPVVKKELKRRYPKHAWPDDPASASPSMR